MSFDFSQDMVNSTNLKKWHFVAFHTNKKDSNEPNRPNIQV